MKFSTEEIEKRAKQLAESDYIKRNSDANSYDTTKYAEEFFDNYLHEAIDSLANERGEVNTDGEVYTPGHSPEPEDNQNTHNYCSDMTDSWYVSYYSKR